jgi:hypothetical protein
VIGDTKNGVVKCNWEYKKWCRQNKIEKNKKGK